MLCSKILVGMSDSAHELLFSFFVHYNEYNSLVKRMDNYSYGYEHVCGNIKEKAMYLISEERLVGLVPDILFECKSKKEKYSPRYYGYLME